MTRDDLRELVWQGMPLLRGRLVGRARIDRITDLVIDRAPLEVLPYIREGTQEEEVVKRAWQGVVKTRYCTEYGEDVIQFGPLFWIVMSPLIQYAIAAILKWWLESRSHRVLIVGWRKEGLK